MRRKTQLVVLLFMTAVCLGAQEQKTGRITRIEFQPATAEEGGGVFCR